MSTTSLSLDIQTVAVIGGGPSGIVTAKLLLAENHFSEVVVYEQRNGLGGVWNYEDPLFPSSVYAGLEANIPSTIMEYSDTQFAPGIPLIPDRSELRDYVKEHGKEIEPIVQFRHRVNSITPTDDLPTAKWHVSVEDITSQSVSERIFDAVVVANGRYDKPNIPDIPGIEAWRAAYAESILHSSTWNDASLYQNKKVIIVGYSASGTDIADHLTSVASKPILVSVNQSPSDSKMVANQSIRMMPKISELLVEDRSVRFLDGSVESGVDAIIFCTGYVYDYPFLSNVPAFRDGRGNQDTYQHIFWKQAPSLAFSLLPLHVTAFPFSEVQAAVIARVWAGRLTLPSMEDMEDWILARMESRDTMKKFHKIGFPGEIDYVNAMLDWCMQADTRDGLPNNGQGFLPSHWTLRKRWLRRVQADIRKAVAAKGAERRTIFSMEQVGFYYPEECPVPPRSNDDSNAILKTCRA